MINLEEFFKEYYHILSGFIVLITTLLFTFMKSYFSEKGKLKASISENEKLIEQTEKIKSQYNEKLENLRKEHQLEIAKRKYQYESKKEQYLKFFNLLDEFSKENNVRMQEKLHPILDEFNRNFLSANSRNDKRNETNAITVFQKKLQKLLIDANQDLLKIKQETNTIKLIASDEVLKKLDFLTFVYDESMKSSNKILNLMILKNPDETKEAQEKLESLGWVINNTKSEIIMLMRDELNKI